MPKFRNAGKKVNSGIIIFSVSQLCHSDIDIPASGTVRYRWSRISPALPSYDNNKKGFACSSPVLSS
jgi:hypothetical protein